MLTSLLAVPLAAAVVTADLPTFPTLAPDARAASGIVVGEDGAVYFVDSFRDIVWRALPGQAPVAFVTGRNGRTLQLAGDGSVLGMHYAEDGAIELWRADGTGTVTSAGVALLPEHSQPYVIDRDGVIATTPGSRRSLRLVHATEFEQRPLAVDHSRLPQVTGMALSSAGGLVVASGAAVHRVGIDGRITTVAKNELLEPRRTLIARLLGDASAPVAAIAEARNGDLYVTNASRRSVLRVQRGGEVQRVFRSDNGWTPTGVAVDAKGMYVLEYGQGVRVRHVAADGAVTVVAWVRPDREVAALPLGRLSASPT